MPAILQPNEVDIDALRSFIIFLKQALNKERRLIIYVCSEAGYQQKTYPLIEELKEKLGAIVVCTVNSSSAAGKKTSLHYGHIGLGGNEQANQIWDHLTKNDILLTLGMEAGEYHFPQEKLPVGDCWCFTNHRHAYGFIKGSYQHRFENNFNIIRGPLYESLSILLEELPLVKLTKPPCKPSVPFAIKDTRKNIPASCVNLIDFYQALSSLWKEPSIGFDDVCVCYRDRQYIMEIAHPNIRFFSSQDGSAMGGYLACWWVLK